ncbi:MAG: hypothetical protein KDC80_19580, partial [Saprospiraceae bacterium]|nr:hypothetical protein [Saprospiraceae bacterium]
MMRLFLVLSLICSALTFTEAHVVLETRLTNASFEPGQTIGITWFILVDHDQIDWNLYFSQDGGDSWEPIEEGLPIEQLSYDWIAPHLESDKMLVQIVQHNNVTENYFDISDTFKIHSVEFTPIFDFDREPLPADISP